MCVRVQSDLSPSPAYDYRQRVVRVPPGLDPTLTLRAVRAAMAELGATQPELGAVCWCGDPIDMGDIPAQRSGEVINSAT